MSPRAALVLLLAGACARGGEKQSATATTPAPMSPGAVGPYQYLFDPSRATNDNQLFLHLLVRDSAVTRSALEPVLPKLNDLAAELPVVLFLASRSGRPVEAIADTRAGGASWATIFEELGVPYDSLFNDVGTDPGPPYSRAWRQWMNNPKDPGLGDEDIEGLVAFYYGRRWSGLAPAELARRAQGRTIPFLVAEKQGRPYEPGANAVLSARPLPPPPSASRKASSRRGSATVKKKAAPKRKPTVKRKPAPAKRRPPAKKPVRRRR